MTNEEMARAVAEIERGLRASDPAFVRGFERFGRSQVATLALAAFLLAACATFLAVGLATGSPALWCLAALALVATLAVDLVWRRLPPRRLRR